MYYFIHGQSIAAVEDSDQAAKYADAGWERVGRAVFMAAWREKDRRAWWAMVVAMETAPLQAREVAAPWRAPWLLIEMPKGK